MTASHRPAAHRSARFAVRSLVLASCSMVLLACPAEPKPIVEPETPRTDVPAEIAAAWHAGNVSSTTFYNPSTGQFSPPSGPGFFFRFKPDGHYEKGVLLQQSLYNCTMTVFFYESGTVEVEGSLQNGWTLQLHPTFGRQKSRDTCVSSNNFEKTHDFEDETLIVVLGRDEYGNEALFVRSPTTSFSAYYRE